MLRAVNAYLPDPLHDAAPALAGALPRAARVLALLLAAIFAAQHAAAQSGNSAKPGDLQEVRKKIEAERRARAALAKKLAEIRQTANRLRAQSVEAARTAQLREAELIRVEVELAALIAQEKASRAGYRASAAQLGRILSVLQRLRLNPPVLLAARPGDPNETVRSAILLESLVPQLQERAALLRKRVEAAAKLRARIEARRKQATKANDGLQKEQARLAALYKQQQAILRELEAERKEKDAALAALSKKAATLQQLLRGIEAKRQRDEAARRAQPPTGTEALTRPSALRPFAEARGHLTLPAAGRISRLYGQPNEFGQLSKGIVISVRPGAQVVAPFDGQIVFAGPFRRYGQILIIKHTGGYHSLIAGLARIDVVLKQWVLSGEPIGIAGAFKSSGPEVYLELRKSGQPFNPLPWIAADQRKVNG